MIGTLQHEPASAPYRTAPRGRDVICLSHVEGAGGPEIGRLLADELGFRYVDDEIVVAAAESEQLLPESVSQAEARHPGRWLEVDFNRVEQTEMVRELIREAIVQTAEEGGVVIVAHAASFALADREGVLRVQITASDDTRLRRLCGEGRDEAAAARAIREADKDHRAYLKHFYGVNRELPVDYDLVVNTDRLSLEAVVETIAHARRFAS
jgi:cytidylate kinase